MKRVEQEVLQILVKAELTDTDTQAAVHEAEMIVNSKTNPSTRLVNRIREYRGVIMGTLGAIGGVAGAALAITLFPDQHISLYNMFISPQQGMSAIGIVAGTSLGERLTKNWS